MDHDRRRTMPLLHIWPFALLAAGMLPAMAQDAAKIQPGSYKVTLDNSQVRVLEYNSRPGMGVCGQGLHSHPAHLTVVLTPGKVRVKHADGKVTESSNEAGLTFWSEAETHEVENVSGRNMRLVLVELKQPVQARPAGATPR
jgi:beta-alanine degradation protein BauB